MEFGTIQKNMHDLQNSLAAVQIKLDMIIVCAYTDGVPEEERCWRIKEKVDKVKELMENVSEKFKFIKTNVIYKSLDKDAIIQELIRSDQKKEFKKESYETHLAFLI